LIDVAVIIVSWNVRDYLADCLSAVCTDMYQSGLTGEIWVVDNASTDGTVSLLEDLYPQVHVIANRDNPGFGAANNQGMRAAREKNPRYYFLLNPRYAGTPGGGQGAGGLSGGAAQGGHGGRAPGVRRRPFAAQRVCLSRHSPTAL
jgi:hypothetical protein